MSNKHLPVLKNLSVGLIAGFLFTWNTMAQETAAPEEAALYSISGKVFDETINLSADIWAALETLPRIKERSEVEALISSIKTRVLATHPGVTQQELEALNKMADTTGKSDSETWDLALDLLVGEILNFRRSVNAVVILRGESNSIERQIILQADNNFQFEKLPEGRYRIEVEGAPDVSFSGVSRKAVGHALVDLTNNMEDLKVSISAYPITLRGRILTEDGNPVAGASVQGLPWEASELYQYPGYKHQYAGSVETKSNIQGEYELKYFIPEHLFIYAGHLIGGANKSLSRGVDVLVHQDGYKQTSTPPLPLTTAELFPMAKRMGIVFFEILSHLGEINESSYEIHTEYLPKSEGNIIFVDDIILEKIEAAE